MDGQRRKKFIWLAIVQIIILLAPKSAKFPSYVESVPINYDSAHRVPRASANLESSLSRLRAIARVANGIYLAQEFINGTDHKEEITSELLKMGSVTPTQIANMDADKLKTAIEALRDLNFVIPAGMQSDIENMKAAKNIKEKYAGIDSITAWPEKDDFKTELGEIFSNGVQDEVLQNVIKSLKNFDTSFDNAKTEKNEVPKLIEWCKKLIEDLPKMTATVQFTKNGKAIDSFSTINRIFDSLDSLNKIQATSLTNATTKASLDTFFAVGDHFSKADLKLVNEVISSRNLPLGLRKLLYTSGLPQGYDDLISVHDDVKEPWMTEKINSSSFKESLGVLQKLNIPLKDSNNKFGTFKDQMIATFSTLSSESEKFVEVFLKRTETETALTEIGKAHGAVLVYAGATAVRDAAVALDGLFDTYRGSLEQAIGNIASEKFIEKLETMTTVLEKPENSGKTLKQIYTTAELRAQDTFALSIRSFKGLLDDSAIRGKCGSIETNLDNVATAMNTVETSHDTLKKIVDLKNLDLVDVFHAALVSASGNNGANQPNYPDVLNAVNTVKSTSDSLGAVVGAIENLKGDSSEPSEKLTLLENPKDVSDQIGNAVRGVVEIKKAIDAIPKIKDLNNSIEQLKTERLAAVGSLTTEENNQLVALEVIDFNKLVNELETFKTAVDSKSIENFKDSGHFFTEAKKLNGISDDLSAILAAFDKLATVSTNTGIFQQARRPLVDLHKINLNFASFQTSYDKATGAVDTLEEFFPKYASAMANYEKPRPHGSTAAPGVTSPKPRNNNQVDDDHTRSEQKEDWLSENIITIVVICVVIAVCSLFCLFIYCYQSDKENKRLKARIVELQAENRRLKAQFDALVYEKMEAGDKENILFQEDEKSIHSLRKKKSDGLVLSSDPLTRKINDCDTIGETQVLVKNIAAFLNDIEDTLMRWFRADQSALEPLSFKDMVYLLYNRMVVLFLGNADKTEKGTELSAEQKKRCRTESKITESTRVKLSDGEFLHANFIPMPNGGSVIAMESPMADGEIEGKKGNIAAVWRMFDEQKVSKIVMLDDIKEKGVPKRTLYFPRIKGETMKFEGVEVTCIEHKFGDRAHYEEKGQIRNYHGGVTVRKLKAVYTKARAKRTRVFFLIRFTEWMEFGRMTNTLAYTSVISTIERCQQPVVVHCSTGLDLTGLVCFSLMATQRMARGKTSAYAILSYLRSKRAGMIRTPEQLAFCINSTATCSLHTHDFKQFDKADADRARTVTACGRQMIHGKKVPTLEEVFEMQREMEKKKSKQSRHKFMSTVKKAVKKESKKSKKSETPTVEEFTKCEEAELSPDVTQEDQPTKEEMIPNEPEKPKEKSTEDPSKKPEPELKSAKEPSKKASKEPEEPVKKRSEMQLKSALEPVKETKEDVPTEKKKDATPEEPEKVVV